ncbi:MAG: PHP domain-containing protein [Candidatus Heimdallarchaeota archaeon]
MKNQESQEPIKPYPVTDLHLHTHYSSDVPFGYASFREYCQLGEQFAIHVGFLDHFEIPEFLHNPKYALIGEQGMMKYLEEFEEVHAEFPNSSLGLEVDYYPEFKVELEEFIDTYRADFCRFIGAIHVIDGKAITMREECKQVLEKYRFVEFRAMYFRKLEAAIESGLFDGIAHIDVLYRFANELFKPGLLQGRDSEVLRLGKLCKDQGLTIELNISGVEHAVKRPYPTLDIVKTLNKYGGKFFVGSDSHLPLHFSKRIEIIRRMNRFLSRL